VDFLKPPPRLLTAWNVAGLSAATFPTLNKKMRAVRAL